MRSVIFLSALLVGVTCYDNNITMGELPPEISAELKGMLKSFSSFPTSVRKDCRRFRDAEVEFHLYTRNNSDTPIILDANNSKQLQPNKKTVLLIHGWLLSANSSGMTQLKNAYLQRYDCNVIIVDWSNLAWKPYSISYCYVPRVSHHVAKFLCQLGEQPNFHLRHLHVVGHSMGAHIAGVVGQFTKSKCKQQVGRITGLDPTGPLFQNINERGRLDPSDALFVSVIHSDQAKFGYLGNVGQVDFHPNCGQQQPGCRSVQDLSNSTLLSDVMCSHHRSLEYMTESVTSSKFVAVSCGMCPRYCRPNLINEIYQVMGEDCRTVPRGANKFYLTTKASHPYAEGRTLYDDKLS